MRTLLAIRKPKLKCYSPTRSKDRPKF